MISPDKMRYVIKRQAETFRSILNLCAYQVIIKCNVYVRSIIASIKIHKRTEVRTWTTPAKQLL